MKLGILIATGNLQGNYWLARRIAATDAGGWSFAVFPSDAEPINQGTHRLLDVLGQEGLRADVLPRRFALSGEDLASNRDTAHEALSYLAGTWSDAERLTVGYLGGTKSMAVGLIVAALGYWSGELARPLTLATIDPRNGTQDFVEVTARGAAWRRILPPNVGHGGEFPALTTLVALSGQPLDEPTHLTLDGVGEDAVEAAWDIWGGHPAAFTRLMAARAREGDDDRRPPAHVLPLADPSRLHPPPSAVEWLKWLHPWATPAALERIYGELAAESKLPEPAAGRPWAAAAEAVFEMLGELLDGTRPGPECASKKKTSKSGARSVPERVVRTLAVRLEVGRKRWSKGLSVLRRAWLEGREGDGDGRMRAWADHAREGLMWHCQSVDGRLAREALAPTLPSLAALLTPDIDGRAGASSAPFLYPRLSSAKREALRAAFEPAGFSVRADATRTAILFEYAVGITLLSVARDFRLPYEVWSVGKLDGVELDFVLLGPRGMVVGVEVKSGTGLPRGRSDQPKGQRRAGSTDGLPGEQQHNAHIKVLEKLAGNRGMARFLYALPGHVSRRAVEKVSREFDRADVLPVWEGREAVARVLARTFGGHAEPAAPGS